MACMPNQTINFSDAEQLASWAQVAVNALVKDGLITGDNGMLNPTKLTTRAEMAQIIYNLLKN